LTVTAAVTNAAAAQVASVEIFMALILVPEFLR
jgi:hypothetical protein